MIKPAKIFGDHMVLQRQKPIQIWGTSTEDCEITVELAGVVVSGKSSMGKWKIELPPMEACENNTLVISSSTEKVCYTDVAVGEVWLAAGQSNMEFYLRYDKDRKNAVENPHIRMFDYPDVAYEGQLEQGDYSDYGFWRTCENENLDYFSAVGYYFAQELEEKYHIPIGIVGCNWGGTPACAWMDPAYLQDTEGDIWLQEYQNALKILDLDDYESAYAKDLSHYRQKPFEDKLNEALMYGVSPEEFAEIIQTMLQNEENHPLSEGPKSEKRPGGLYNSMVKKVAPYTVRGVLWYQGENDDSKPDIYHVVLSQLIKCWRDLWKDELPFLIVQLASFRYWDQSRKDCFPIIRKKQEWVSQHSAQTWMTAALDMGMEHDIHPKEKKPIGNRLALLARGHVYGEDILCDLSECIDISIEDNRLMISFNNTGDGLRMIGEEIPELKVSVDGENVKAKQTIVEKNRIILCAPSFSKDSKICVEYAENDFCEVNLYNSAGLPIKPFTRRI